MVHSALKIQKFSTYAPFPFVRVEILQLIKFWTLCCISQTGRGTPRNLQISQETGVHNHQVIRRIHCRTRVSLQQRGFKYMNRTGLSQGKAALPERLPCTQLRAARLQRPFLQSHPFISHSWNCPVCFLISPLENVRFRQDYRITEEFVCKNLHQPEKPLSPVLTLGFIVSKSIAW